MGTVQSAENWKLNREGCGILILATHAF